MQPSDIITQLNKVVGLHADITPAGLSRYTLTDQRDGLPLKVLDGIKDCANPVSVILEKARADASANFVTDFSAEFSEVYTPTIPDYTGNVGKLDQSMAINNARSKAVVQLWSWGSMSVLSIRAVQLYGIATAEIEVSIFSENDLTEPVAQVTVSAQSGKWVRAEFESPALLDLSGQDFGATDGRPRYFVVWDIPSGAYPRANKFTCCSRREDFYPFFEAHGYSVESLSEMSAPITAKSHGAVGMGVSLEASAACTFNVAFSRLDYSIFSASGWQWVLAKTLQHGGVMNLADAFVKSQNINQYTLLSRESVYGIRAHAEKEYQKGLKWLVQNMPGAALSNFKCRDTLYRVGEILV